MGIPGTGAQLLVLLLFVLPGSVYQTVRTRLRGPIPSDHDATSKVLRALAVSTGLNALYLAVFADALLRVLQARSLDEVDDTINLHLVGLWAMAFLFAVPSLLACLVFWLGRWDWRQLRRRVVTDERMAKVHLEHLAYYPSPRTWDFSFLDQGHLWVRIRHADGTWIGGKFGGDSLVASFPEPLDLFLEQAWEMGPAGDFVSPIAGSKGVYIRCEDAVAVERFDGWVDPPGYIPKGEQA